MSGRQALGSSNALHPRYVLGILTVIMLFNTFDRYVFAMLIQPIKRDLDLSDVQISLLTGFAFSAFYAIFSLPISRLSDRGYRYRVVWLSMSVWSVMTALCGLSQHFWHLILFRFGVGVGEAGASPASQSIITSLFPPNQRSTALSVFLVGGATGGLMAFLAGGWLEHAVGWRLTFLCVALPSIPIVALYLLTIRDPASPMAAQVKEQVEAGSIWHLLRNRTLVHVCLASGYQAFLFIGVPQWLPAYLERSHGLARSEIGLSLATTNSLGSVLGLLVGGLLGDRISARYPLGAGYFMLISSILSFPLLIGMLLAQHLILIYVCMTIGAFLIAMPGATLFATSMGAVKPDERASAAAAVIIAVSFLGLGLLPLIVGSVSDLLAASQSGNSLRWALVVGIVIAAPLLAYHLFRIIDCLRAQQHQTAVRSERSGVTPNMQNTQLPAS